MLFPFMQIAELFVSLESNETLVLFVRQLRCFERLHMLMREEGGLIARIRSYPFSSATFGKTNWR